MYDRYKRVLFCAGFLLSFCFVLQAQGKGLRRVATNDCGVDNAQPFLIKGENDTLQESFPGSKEAKTINVGNTLIYAFDQMDIQAGYQMEVVYLADKRGEQRVVADGNEVQAPVVLEKGVEQRYVIDLPKKAYAYGQLVLVFEALNGDNAVVSELNLYSSNPAPLKPFEGDRKKDLVHIQAYTVDTTVCAEKVLPIYAIKPHLVAGVYNPVLSLNGIWSFNEKPATYFYERKQMGQEWKPIVVPGQWSMQGFQVDSAAFGGYQTTFTLPADWSGKRVKLRFDGVSSESVVYLNGKEIGSHMGGMTAFELDVTNGLRSGENVLALRVRSESLADMLGSLTQYAAHQLGGITHKVTLFAVPEVHLSDLRIVTDLDDAYKDAELKVYVSVTNASANVQKNLSVRLSVSGEPVVLSQAIPEIAAGSTWSGWLTGKIASPKKWDSEHPNLYTLKVELETSEKIVEQVKKRFGFREIQIQGNRMLVNGKAVKLKGVCRHEMHPLTGRVMNPALARKDIELYRDANCNFIRTSHYPPCEEMLEVCDELGMFVEVEAPVCWLGHHANENWKVLDYREQKYYPYVLQVNMEMIQFYRNHPSIIFWSMANESYWNKEFAQVQVYMEKADPTRPFTFHDQGYGGFNNQGSTAPISNIHYPGPDGYKVAAKSDRPMTYGEYCHLNVYNRSELVTDPGVRSDWALALAPTWENMYKTPGVLGGSIWSGIDDIFQLPNGDAVGYGAWGPIDGWRRPKPEYWDMKKIYSPIRVTTKTLSPAKELVIDLENRYTYTNLNELQVNWVYGEEKGSIFVNLEPGEKGQLRVRPVHPEKANELYLSFVDPCGFTADEYLIPVGRQIQNESQVLAAVPTRLKEKKDRYMITGKDFTCEISRISGQILSVKKGKKEVLNGGPWLMALPLTSGGCYPNHNANTPAFNDLCSDWKVEKVDAVREGNDVVVKVKGAYKEFAGSYDLKVNANGELSVVYAFDALEDVNPRQWGLVFEAPVSFDQTFWRRDGLWSVYPSDHISRPVGEASLFYEGLPEKVDPRTEPAWSWSMDYNELGSNDFRSTRRNIWYAGLRSMNGSKITVPSNGRQHWRSWLEKDKIRFLVADFATAGNEIFLSTYYDPYRKPVRKGERIGGEILVRVE
ncbi:MAG: Beta-galactosidase [Parabacteroides distasonis]